VKGKERKGKKEQAHKMRNDNNKGRKKRSERLLPVDEAQSKVCYPSTQVQRSIMVRCAGVKAAYMYGQNDVNGQAR
jgi:hypothetical protein